jgi:hypothetical protein
VHRRTVTRFGVLVAIAALAAIVATTAASENTPTNDISTLAGKSAAVGSAGLAVRFSAFLEQEAQDTAAPAPTAPITPTFVPGSPLDGTSVAPPAVTVNQDTAGAPQNETAIAVDPANPNRLVAAANDYVSRTWACTISGTPCSALGDGYSGTYYSNDGGATWCCTSSDPSNLGTLIPGVERLTGGPYDAGGDPALAFDSSGHVYYAGLGFNRTSAPNTVTVSRGTFDGSGALTWSQPTFVNQTSSPSTLNDKEWIAVDSHATSPYRDRVYVTWTRFIFNPVQGSYVQSPIMSAYSSDGGQTFSSPEAVTGNALYSQGSRPVVGPDGTVYVFWDGATRHAALDSIYMARSTDGGASWSKPIAISDVADSIPLRDTAFRVNSFPAAAVTPDGALYATWTTEAKNDGTGLAGTTDCADWIVGGAAVRANCHSVAVYSRSLDGGFTWTTPQPVFGAATRSADGYPVTNPDGSTLNAPDPLRPVEDIFPAVAAGPDGTVYVGAYRGDVVSPWQTCAAGPPPPQGRIDCSVLGPYVDNTRLDYVVANVTGGGAQTVSTHPINTRNGFGGGFFGDYTDLTVGSNGLFHAFWTDSNNQQSVVWFYGLQFVPTPINQEDVVIASGQ